MSDDWKTANTVNGYAIPALGSSPPERIATALESIARSLHKIANPMFAATKEQPRDREHNLPQVGSFEE